MATENTRPTTLPGVKRLAKFIKRAEGIPLHAALDEAAQKAGFQNLRHAQSVLGHCPRDLHRTFVTLYWAEHEDRPHSRERGPVLRSGRTTLEFFLPVTLEALLPGRSIERTPYVRGFRLDAPDHLEFRGDSYSERDALEKAKRAALSLNFMATTGLRARLAGERAGPSLNLSENKDHLSYWYDEESRSVIILDEPYKFLFEDEIAWAQDHGFQTVGVRWRGIYLAGWIPRLHAEQKVALPTLVEKLEALEARLKDEKWTFNFYAYESQFVSPGGALSGKRKPPRTMPTSQGVERSGAVPCGPGQPGFRSEWRPARRMDLDKHLHIGPIISSLSYSALDWTLLFGSTLYRWFSYEYDVAELPDKQLLQVYDLPNLPPITGSANLLSALDDVRQTVDEGYQDCQPKRELLKQIDRAERWVRRHP